MNTTKTMRTLAAAAALAVGITLAGCSTDSSDDGGHGGHDGVTSAGSGRSAATHDEHDVAFAQQMLPHHRQAVEMSETLLDKGSGVDPDVVAIAEQIAVEQSPEIDTLSGWLREWGEPTAASGTSGTDHSSMSGMMSDDDVSALDDASAQDAGELFLRQMIEHHTGAVEMARSEVEQGRNADAVALAESIISGQTAEIDQMRDVLAAM